MADILAYNGWATAYQLANESLRLIVLPQIGARLISLLYADIEFLRQNPEASGRLAEPGDDWPNWGGSFDWVGPQSDWNDSGWPPPFELDSGPWEIRSVTSSQIELVSASSPLGVRLYKKFTLKGAQVTIERQMENVSSHEICWGLWNVLQVTGEGRIVLPAEQPDFALLKLFDWPEVPSISTLQKSEILALNPSGTAYQINPERGKFKIGYLSTSGEIHYELRGHRLCIRTPVSSPAYYPHGCNIEVYRDDQNAYTELEQLWPMTKLAPSSFFSSLQYLTFE